jgi:hypothetical protein
MANGKFVSYIRVSTQRQGRSGLGLEAQRDAVTNHLNGGRWSLIAEVVEVESGKRSDRPKLAEALRLCRASKATLVIAKLDRLARNVAFIANLMESGVEFVACDMPQANRFTLHILAAVAEHEAAMISARTKAALAAAKARGIRLGASDPNRIAKTYPAADTCSVVYSGKIYVIGGYGANASTYLDYVQIYDPTTDSWSQGATLPTPTLGRWVCRVWWQHLLLRR